MSEQKLLIHARDLRRRSTQAEAKLWHRIRARRLCGTRFRRQHPIGPWIVDFYCAEAKLVVELDGGAHADASKTRSDAQRTKDLEKLGIRVLRFWNTDVHRNVEGVLATIALALGAPSPYPSPPGGRG